MVGTAVAAIPALLQSHPQAQQELGEAGAHRDLNAPTARVVALGFIATLLAGGLCFLLGSVALGESIGSLARVLAPIQVELSSGVFHRSRGSGYRHRLARCPCAAAAGIGTGGRKTRPRSPGLAQPVAIASGRPSPAALAGEQPALRFGPPCHPARVPSSDCDSPREPALTPRAGGRRRAVARRGQQRAGASAPRWARCGAGAARAGAHRARPLRRAARLRGDRGGRDLRAGLRPRPGPPLPDRRAAASRRRGGSPRPSASAASRPIG